MTFRFELVAGDAKATLAPDWGGRMLSLRNAAGHDVLYPFTACDCDLMNWPKGGAFPLIPFNGRIRNGTFRFQGRAITLARQRDGGAHAVHGSASKKPWSLADRSDATATLTLDSAADGHWPWDYRATQRFALEAHALTVSFALQNTGTDPMPGAIGWHPYFSKATALETDASDEFAYDAEVIPTGARSPERSDLFDDHTFLYGAGRVTMQTVNLVRIKVAFSRTLDHLVTLQAAPAYTCVEPVSHLPNHIAGADDPHHCAILEPGATLTGSVRIEFP